MNESRALYLALAVLVVAVVAGLGYLAAHYLP